MEIAQEREKEIEEFCRGKKVRKSPNFPHQRFSQHARDFPESLAIISDSQNMTFRELDLSSNRFANLLKSRGVERNKVVVIQLDRSLAMVVSVLGVYKAGGSCVLIEPAAPPYRLEKMMSILQPQCVITTKSYAENYSRSLVSLFLKEDLDAFLSCFPDVPPGVHVAPEDTAHIFFTSGSEGEPKAVAFPYGWQADGAQPEPMSERHIYKTDSGTTFTRAEILRPLSRGQQLYIAPSGLERNFRELAEYITSNSITHLISTPTALRELLATEEVKNCRALRSVTCSGEKISSQLKREFFARLNAELVVSYGCTEVPGAVSYVMTREDDPDHDVAGKVAPLMEAYVVDSALNILPVGVEGEIFLGGLMATGYLNNPLLTQERFIANPFDTDKSSRLFKTGDRGCWVKGGFLQVKGRNDGLVKIRGYRVEITEVEETIARLPFVRQAAVVSEISGVGINNLMAFVAVSSGPISVGDIKIALSKMLPDYMIPSRFILADELPLTASGKIDRKALIPSSFENDKPMTLSRIPDNLERELISIWRGVLDVKKIDVRDNFFDLGGSSLLAAQMIDQVERFFDVRVPLDLVWFRGGTVESLAVILREGSSGPDNMGLVNIKSGKGNPLFFVHVRGGHLSDYYHLARCMSPEQAVYGLQARGVFGIERPDSSVPEMAAYCIENMKRVQAAGPYMIAGYSSGGTVAFEMAKQLKAMEEEVRMLVLLDTFCPVVELSRRWKKAFMRLCEGKTHDLRDAVYASLIRGLKLEKMLKFRDLDSAHKWAYRLYKPSEERLSVEFIVAARSVEKINDDFLGWGNYLAESSSVSQFPGGHVEIIRYPTVIDVAKVLQSRIDALS